MRALEFIKRPQSSAVAFIVAGAVWFFTGAVYGIFSATQFVSPEAITNIPALVFGRTRPAHVNTMVYGFVGSTLIGVALYFVPALFKRRLWSEKLGWLSFVLYTGAVLSGPITFGFGISQGREYAEYVWAADLAIVTAFLLILLNAFMTAVYRRERTLYVSTWYVFATLIAMSASYVVGNAIWNPPEGAVAGLLDSIILWFYAHNLVGLLLTPMALGAAYFIVPRITRLPLYSHVLSLVGFWAFVAFYTHIGAHHILQSPIPNWLKTFTIVDSIGMFIPVAIFLANIWLSMRGRLAAVWHDMGGRWVLTGTIWYLITCIQGPLQSLPSLQRVTHFNNWVIGHSHIAVLGFSGFIALGVAYHVLPHVVRKRWYSRKLVSLQFALVLFGITGFFLVLTMAGLIQGGNWYFNGETVYRVLPELVPYFVLRAFFGVFILAGALIGLVNIGLTLWRGEPIREPTQGEAAQ